MVSSVSRVRRISRASSVSTVSRVSSITSASSISRVVSISSLLQDDDVITKALSSESLIKIYCLRDILLTEQCEANVNKSLTSRWSKSKQFFLLIRSSDVPNVLNLTWDRLWWAVKSSCFRSFWTPDVSSAFRCSVQITGPGLDQGSPVLVLEGLLQVLPAPSHTPGFNNWVFNKLLQNFKRWFNHRISNPQDPGPGPWSRTGPGPWWSYSRAIMLFPVLLFAK